MMNAMIRATANNDTTYHVCIEKNANKLVELFEELDVKCETFSAGQMPLESLPEEVQEKAKSILRAFDQVSVNYENGSFRVSASICLTATYARDHFVCGRYNQTDVYTKEERKQNFFEEFGYIPAWLA